MNRRTNPNESGMALLISLIVLILLSALSMGFYSTVTNSQRLERRDVTKSQAFYASYAGAEKLTADLGNLFSSNYAPTGAQINALTSNPPTIPLINFLNPQGGSGYEISFPTLANGNPSASNRNISTGPYAGFVGLVTPYTLTSTARSQDGSETRIRRTMNTVSIPVFQFGIFSESALSFFPGPNFDFGGRVHTNENLFLASGAVLTLADRVTAVGEIIRTNLSNGWPVSSGYTGTVRAITSPGSYRNLSTGEGSLVGTVGSSQNEPTWTTLSISTYNGSIRNGRTGAKRLELPLVSMGATAIDLIRRPPTGEDTANPNVYNQRYYTMASLRILLSDTSTAITSLPATTATSPVLLGNLSVNPVAGYTVDATHAPFAVTDSTSQYRFAAGTPSLGGYLKIEMQTAAGTWQDVTLEILNLGTTGRNLRTSLSGCTNPNADAVIRLQRIRDSNTTCNLTAANWLLPRYFYPNVLYDPREGNFRDNISTTQTTVYLGGVMHYIELDMDNLRRWFAGSIGSSGSNALNVNGYVVYFSDRRGNRNASGNETGEYGFEDVINSASSSGTPNYSLEDAEDVNGNSTLDNYGLSPVFPASGAGSSPMDSSARPWTSADATAARANPAILFRRALKMVNGSLGNISTPGVTVVSENPVYIEGNFNASSAGFGSPHAACAVIADAVTLLSNSWNDLNSFTSPNNPAGRTASTTWYRTAVIAGKGLSFTRPTGYSTYQDFGTDGGAHNFLRYIEDWGGSTLNYRGSIISFYNSQQAVGTYKCCTNVYDPPSRGYNFDTEFLQPSLLPPRTPMFRDINVTGFTQLILPTQ